MTITPCLWMSRFHERGCLHPTRCWICIGVENCNDYEADVGMG